MASRAKDLETRIAAIAESATLAVDAKAKALKAQASRSSASAPASRTSRRPRTSSRRPSRRAATRRTTATRRRRACPSCARRSRPRPSATPAMRSRAVAGAGDQRRQARRLQHAAHVARRGRRGAAPGALLDDLSRADPARGRDPGRAPHHRGDRLPGHRRPARGGPHRPHEAPRVRVAVEPDRRGVRPRRDRGDRAAGPSSTASGW